MKKYYDSVVRSLREKGKEIKKLTDQMNQIMESRGSLESLPEMIAGRIKRLFSRK